MSTKIAASRRGERAGFAWLSIRAFRFRLPKLVASGCPLCGRFCQAHRIDSTSELPIEGGVLATSSGVGADALERPSIRAGARGADHRILYSPGGDCEVSWRRPH